MEADDGDDHDDAEKAVSRADRPATQQQVVADDGDPDRRQCRAQRRADPAVDRGAADQDRRDDIEVQVGEIAPRIGRKARRVLTSACSFPP